MGGSGTGVSVGASVETGVPVAGTTSTAVFVGFGVFVDVGGMKIGPWGPDSVNVAVGGIAVRVAVGEDVGDEV